MRTAIRHARHGAFGLAFAVISVEASALAQTRHTGSPIPDGAELVRRLGRQATAAFASPGSPVLGALVRMPAGVHGADVGLDDVAPGIARLWGTPARIVAFGDAHPDLPIEVTPPLHPLLDTASVFVGAATTIGQGLDGSGVIVGIADTGLDVTHPDFLDANGNTRVAWLLDLSQAPLGMHADLEAKFAVPDVHGNPAYGAVWSGADIDAAAARHKPPLPQDTVGHGTLVAACAAGNGMGGKSPYRGVAPGATLVIANVAQGGADSIDTLPLLNGVDFIFDRATALGMPAVANVSIGGDFGPHDGTMAWEEALASHVGTAQPGRVIVAAAGNSGSIVDAQVHENVHVSSGSTMRVPILTNGAFQQGGAQVWVAMHPGTDLQVGLDGPDGSWIDPVAANDSAGKNTNDYQAGIYNGSQPANSPVPAQSHGAVVVWQGVWPAGTYYVTLVGSGTADLYVEGTGDAAIPGFSSVGFAYGVREGTINLPATHPSIVGVGCTVNHTNWQSLNPLASPSHLFVPLLDGPGGMPAASQTARYAIEGEPCYFSSAGPTLTGVQKPEIMAPGSAIIGALSQQALPSVATSIFSASCPPTSAGTVDSTCQQIDAAHGVSSGTSFSSPLVAGAVAALLQRDPTLTEDAIVAALQGGAHRLRGPAPFDDQASVGELDVPGAVTAADRLRSPQAAIPDRAESWLSVGADTYLADGSTPLEATLELRTPVAGGPVVPADAFGDGRLVAYARVDGASIGAWPCTQGATRGSPCWRRGPGVWVVDLKPSAGLGGSTLTLGATFDGADIVDPHSLPIATDTWNGTYPPSVRGGCSLSSVRGEPDKSWAWALVLGVLGLRGRVASRRSRAAAATFACRSAFRR